MSLFESYFSFFQLFFFVIAIQSIVFWIVCKFKFEKQWNKRFYHCVEVFEDSNVESSIVWSFLTDPKKFMNFNYRNKIKWVDFKPPLMGGSAVRIRLRYAYGFKGFVSFFDQESKIVYEYHAWPNATRYICEIEVVRLEDKTRYVLRMKLKKLFLPLIVPLIKIICPKIDKIMKKLLSDLLHNCLVICEEKSSKKVPCESTFQNVETIFRS